MEKIMEKMKNNIKKYAIIAGIIGIVGIMAAVIIHKKMANREESFPEIKTIRLEKQDLEKVLSITGTIVSENKKMLQSAVTEVKVTTIEVEVGDFVKKGDILCILDSAELESKKKNAEKNSEIVKQKAELETENAGNRLEDAQLIRDRGLEQNNQMAVDAFQEYEKNVERADQAFAAWQNAITERKKRQTEAGNMKQSAQSTTSSLQRRKSRMENKQQELEEAESRLTEAKNRSSVSGNQAASQEEIDRLTRERDAARAALSDMRKEYNEKEMESGKNTEGKSDSEAAYSEAKSLEKTKEEEYKQAVTNVENAAKEYKKILKEAQNNVRIDEKNLKFLHSPRFDKSSKKFTFCLFDFQK